MGAKGTVIKTNEENCHNTLEERLDEQARASFKAGQEPAYGIADIMAKGAMEKSCKAGVKEVLEELNHYYIGGVCIGSFLSSLEGWQAKLKEWEIYK